LKEYPQTKNIPVIFLTALIPKTDEGKYDPMAGGNIIFAKPLDTEKLLEQIKRLTNVTDC
jgi:CheY-like chemotaxis protein